MTKSVEAILEVNAAAELLCKAIACKISSPKKGERKAAKSALLGMLEIQKGITTDLIEAFEKGITFELWFASFKKWNTPRNWERMGLKTEGRKLYKRMMVEGDFEKYFVQHILPMETLIDEIKASSHGLDAMAESISNTKV